MDPGAALMRDPCEVVLVPASTAVAVTGRWLSVADSLQMDPHEVLDSIPGPHETRRRIQRHCRLAAASSSRFAVVVFEVGGAAADAAVRLVHALWQRARGGDEIGWFGRQRLAVLLRGTSHWAAHRLATDLSGVLAAGGEPPRFQVLAF
jgi:hypothetical protein